MIAVPAEAITNLIGKPYRYTTTQWINIFGKENAKRYKTTKEVQIDKDFIWLHYNDSREKGYTTEMFAYILMYIYVYWVNYKAGDICGMEAEVTHDRIIMCIATFYKINMKTSAPFQSIMNMFTRIRKQTWAMFHVDNPNSKNRYHQKKFENNLKSVVQSLEGMTMVEDNDVDNLIVDTHAWNWSYGLDESDEN